MDILSQIEPLRRYARVLTRDAEAADDLVQATLLRAHERASSFRDGANVRVWLMSILHNLFIDQSRSTRARGLREQDWAGLNPGFATPAGEQAARLAQLRRAMLGLPSEQREALHLVAIEGLEIAEAAIVLEVPAGTVMSRLGRARATLRAYEDGAQPRLKLVKGQRDDRA
jgi:RNA polymerase sigma-70 factor, ECF subfamily